MFQKEEVLQLALKSNDMLFHSALYDWLFSTNRSDKLLEVSVADDSGVHFYRADDGDDVRFCRADDSDVVLFRRADDDDVHLDG